MVGKIDVLTGLIGSSRNQENISRVHDMAGAVPGRVWQTSFREDDWFVTPNDDPKPAREGVGDGLGVPACVLSCKTYLMYIR